MFDKYYLKSDESPLYAAAIILHPERRTRYIRANWEKKWQRPALEKVKGLWEDYRSQALGPETLSTQPSVLPYGQASTKQELDSYDRIVKDLNKFTRPQSQDEYEDYITDPPSQIGKLSALEWWCQEQQRVRWPRLSLLAITILSIPAMSDEPERSFSGARRTISWERMQMGVETLERAECLKQWQRTELSLEVI